MGFDNTEVESCKLTDCGVSFLGCLCGCLCHQCCAGILLVGKFLLTHGNREFTLGVGVYPGCQVLLAIGGELFKGCDITLVRFHATSGICHGATMRPVQAFQLFDVRIQLYLLHDQRGARSQCLDLSSGECYLAGVLGLTAHILAVHYLVDEVLLSFQNVPQPCIEAAFGNISEVFHFIIDVPLTVGSAVSLFHITGSPRRVQMVNGHDTLLSVHAHAHLTGGTDQHSYLSVVHICKQFLFLGIGVRFMDKGNFFSGDTALYQPGFDIVVELCAFHIGLDFLGFRCGRAALALRGSHITEDNLGTLDFLTFLVLNQNIVSASVDLTPFLIRQGRVDHTLGVGNLSAITGDLQHVVNGRINILDVVRSLFQFLHIVLLELSGFTDHNIDLAALHLGDFQTGNIGQYVRKVPEQQLQLAHVLKPGKALLHTVALSAGLDLHAVDNFAKLLRPGIKSGKPKLIQQIRLQILLHDVHFAHGVHNRCCSGEHDTTAAVQLLQVAYLGVKVKSSLAAVLIAQTSNIGHGSGVEQILEVVGLVHEDTVHAQLFKINVPLILGAVRQFFNLGLQGFALLFQVLNRKALAALFFLCFLNGPDHAVNLLLVKLPGEICRHRQSFKLLIAYDHRIIIAVGNAVHENFSIGSGKIACFRHQQLCRREEVHKLISPLRNQGFRNCKHRFLHKAKFLQLHRCRCHFVGLACTNFMGE